MCICSQERHLHTETVKSETAWDSRNAFWDWGELIAECPIHMFGMPHTGMAAIVPKNGFVVLFSSSVKLVSVIATAWHHCTCILAKQNHPAADLLLNLPLGPVSHVCDCVCPWPRSCIYNRICTAACKAGLHMLRALLLLPPKPCS